MRELSTLLPVHGLLQRRRVLVLRAQGCLLLTPYVGLACAVVIGTVFAVSSVSKVHSRRDMTDFTHSTRAMLSAVVGPRLAGGRVATTVAWAVVVLEAVILPLVLLPATAGPGLVVAGLMLTVFSAAVRATIRSGTPVSCRCFGNSTAAVRGRHLWRNGLLGAAALIGLIAHSVQPERPPVSVGAAVACASGLVAALFLIRLDDLVDLIRPSRVGSSRRERKTT